MKIKAALSIICASWFCALSVFAQETASGKALTWQDCVSIAARNNPGLISSQRSLDASKANYSGSYNGVYPSLSLSHRYSNSEDSAGSGSRVTSWQTSAQANWSIFDMSEINNIQLSQILSVQAQANLKQASASLRYNLAKAFYQLLFDQENIKVSKNIVEMRDKEAQLVALRYDSGTEYKGNMLRAKAQLLQAKADLAQSIRNLRADQRALNQQLGIDEFTFVSATSTLAVQEPGDFPKDFEPLLRSRPDVIVQQAILVAAQLNVSRAKTSLWPAISANYSLSNSGPDEFSGAPRSAWGVGLNYPLFGNGPTAAYYSISAAKSNLEKSKQDTRSVRQSAISDIESSWSSFAGAIDQVKVQSALLEAARTRNDEADIRYSSGLTTYDQWEIIASDRINQEHQVVQSRLNALNAEAAWARALGKQLEE
jgi:outer membrane protein, multidrug efflux system